MEARFRCLSQHQHEAPTPNLIATTVLKSETSFDLNLTNLLMEGFTPTDGLSEKDGGEQTDHGGEGELGM
jgi:hypothetical protein